MKFMDLLEGKNSKCIIVDVQPAYSSYINNADNMMSFLNKQGEVLIFVNAEQDGLTEDTVADVQMYWEDEGYDEQKWNQSSIVDKGYGYLRTWMDAGIDDAIIIAVIREMYAQQVNDSRNLFDGDESEDYIEKMHLLTKNMVDEEMFSDNIITEWTSIAQLKQFSGAYLMGGGRDECLKEVTLLMNAFNIKYKLVDEFIYG